MVAPPHSPMGARAPPTTKMLMGNHEICVANSAFKKQEMDTTTPKTLISQALYSAFSGFFSLLFKNHGYFTDIT